jgi:hypothetical protein
MRYGNATQRGALDSRIVIRKLISEGNPDHFRDLVVGHSSMRVKVSRVHHESFYACHISWFEGRSLDGLNVHLGHPSQFTRFTQEVVPILQERGVFRREYEEKTLRGNFGLEKPRAKPGRPSSIVPRFPRAPEANGPPAATQDDPVFMSAHRPFNITECL